MMRVESQGHLIHVGRQPIYDRAGDVFAYELLFRDAAGATMAAKRSAQATSQVMVAAFTEFGLDQLVGSKACFINVTKEFLVGELPVPFGSDQAVLEVVETVEVDDAVIAGVRGLIERGFTIALDDFTPGGHEQLLHLATYVKIDLMDADPDQVARSLALCRAHPHVQLIAERLESETDLQRAFALGFDFFQGHVLGRPHVVSAVGLSPARLNRLQLLTALTAEDIDFDGVVSLIIRDPAVSYRMLQATNSAASGLNTRVSSVKEAAVLLGLNTVRQWVTLMLVSDLTAATEDQLSTIMTRARICQTVALEVGLPGDSAFTIGLLSGIADMVGQSQAELASHLPLSDDVDHALADGEGPLGSLLAVIREYERGYPAGLARLIDPEQAVKAYLDAVTWSNRLVTSTQR
jgi:EAL and modified HD-GYP domain-containing signal transduction protein